MDVFYVYNNSSFAHPRFLKVCLFLLSFSIFLCDNISVNSMSSQCWNYPDNHVTVDPLEPGQLSLRSKSHSLALKFTSWEDWSRFVLSLSGSLFANEFWMWGAWLWSATMETFLIGMNPSLLLTGDKCDFLKFTTMSIIVPTRQRNRIKPHNILCKLTIKQYQGFNELLWKFLSMKRKKKNHTK